MAGQVAGMVQKVAPAAQILRELAAGCEPLLKNLAKERGITVA